MQRLLKLCMCTIATVFLILSIGENAQAAVSYTMPANSGFKAYMDYRKITNKKSAQWRLQQSAITDENGIRTVDGRYCVSVGSYFGAPVGTKLDVTLESGNVLECIVADRKMDKDTDSMNLCASNGNIVEFIVNTDTMDRKARHAGDLSALDGFDGIVTKVVVYDNDETEVTEVVKPVISVETIDVDGIELTTLNYESNSDISSIYVDSEVYETLPEEMFITYTPEDELTIL